MHIHHIHPYHRGNGLSCHPSLSDRVSKMLSHHELPSFSHLPAPSRPSDSVCPDLVTMLLYPVPPLASCPLPDYRTKESTLTESSLPSFTHQSSLFFTSILYHSFQQIHTLYSPLNNHNDADLCKFPHSRCRSWLTNHRSRRKSRRSIPSLPPLTP